MPGLTEQVHILPIWKSFLSFLYRTCLRFSLFSNISNAPLKFSKPRGKKKKKRIKETNLLNQVAGITELLERHIIEM